MQTYHFVLHNGFGIDQLGVMALGGDHDALEFAQRIISDVLCGSAEPYVGWSLEIINDERNVGRIPFSA